MMDTGSNSQSSVQMTSRANKQNADDKREINDEEQALIQNSNAKPSITPDDIKKSELVGSISKTGLKVLVLLACQNCFKNILMRYVMADHGGFLLSTAVIVVELLKLFFATVYIVIIQKQSIFSIVTFLKEDWKNTVLLAVPATAYSVQMTLEYVAFKNIDPAMFSVLVQMKMLTTAFFFRTVLGKRQKKKQIISLVLLTVGVMLCNMRMPDPSSTDAQDAESGNRYVGILATIGIACSSGFASVYTEKVIKSSRKKITGKGVKMEEYGLAYMQAQLAIVSLLFLGMYCGIKDLPTILEKGMFHNYSYGAFCSSLNSAVGGLIVAAALKHADSVLKGYATAVSVVLTGVSSHFLFGTDLTVFYGMGIVNVIVAVLLYNSNNLDDFMC